MITFEEIDKSEVVDKYKNCFDEDVRYFKVIKGKCILCIYGLVSRGNKVIETFWVTESFHNRVFTKSFFVSLFKHAFSLGYTELYTWTRWEKLIDVFGHFKSFGIEKTECPPWDKDETKTWFIKRI